MKVILFVCVLLVAGVVGLGFYLGWFHFSVDADKFKEDMKTAEEKVKGAGSSAKTMEGKVVSVSGDQLTMANKEGQEHSHTLAANVKVTCDGKACTTSDLKAEMRIRVTTEKAAPHEATRVEALDNNGDFEKGG